MSNIIQSLPFYLNQPLGASDTTIQVRGLKDSRGNLITAMPSGVALIHVTIEPKSPTNQEIISFTGITDNGNGVVTLTGVTRNLSPVSPFTALTPDVPHANNSTCVISNNPQIFQDVVMTNEARTVSSVVTFSASPIVPTAVNAGEPVNKSQLDLAVLGTVPASSTTVLGAVRVTTDTIRTLGTATMTIASPCVVTFNAHALTANDTIRFTTSGALPTGLVVGTTYYVIATGLTVNTFQLSLTAGGSAINTSGGQSGTHTLYRTTPYVINDQDSRVDGNAFATATGSANAFVVTPTFPITSYVTGRRYSFIANFSITGASTVNYSGLGAKTIKKLDGATDLIANDIKTGQVVELEYDGTNFQMLSPVGNAQASKFGGTGVDGALNVTSGTTTIDLAGVSFKILNYTSINISVGATLAFSNPATTGTLIHIKSQGGVTIAGTISANALGGAGGTAGSAGADGGAGQNINPALLIISGGGTGGAGGTVSSGVAGTPPTSPYFYLPSEQNLSSRLGVTLVTGSGGGGGRGSGSGVGGAGGRGGGALYIECAGAWNFTGTINTSGATGATGSGGAGGGGGGAGMLCVLYNTLTASSGTHTNNSGAGGTGGSGSGGGNTNGGGGGITAGATGGNGQTNNVGTAGVAGGGGGGGAAISQAGGSSSTSANLSLIRVNDYFL